MTEQPHDAELIDIINIDQFASLIAGWHRNRLGQLEQALTAPDDVEIIIEDEQGNGEPLPLSLEQRKAFRAGLIVAKSLFGTLPFTMTPVEAEAAEGQDPGNDLDLPEACEHAANLQAASEAPVQPLLDEVIHGA